MTRRAWFFATYFVVLTVGVSATVHVAPRLLWNETASVPVGLYRGEGHLHTKAEPAHHPIMPQPQVQHGLVHAVQHGGGDPGERHTRHREPRTRPQTLEQGNTKRVLQCLDRTCQRPLVHLQGQGRPTQTAMLRNRDDTSQITKVKWVFLCHLKTPIVPHSYLRDQTFLP